MLGRRRRRSTFFYSSRITRSTKRSQPEKRLLYYGYGIMVACGPYIESLWFDSVHFLYTYIFYRSHAELPYRTIDRPDRLQLYLRTSLPP